MRRFNIIATLVFAGLALLGWAVPAHHVYLRGNPWNVPIGHYILPSAFTLVALVGWLVLAVGVVRGDDETRCRKCKYILRGISEPRCPECGERT